MDFIDELEIINKSKSVEIDEQKHKKIKKYLKALVIESRFIKNASIFGFILCLIMSIYIFITKINNDIITAIFIPILIIGLAILFLLAAKNGTYKINSKLIEKIENRNYKMYKYTVEILKVYYKSSKYRTTYYLESKEGYLFDIKQEEYKYIKNQIEQNNISYIDVYLVEEIFNVTENITFNSIPVIFVDR